MSPPALGIGLVLGAGREGRGWAELLSRVEHAEALGLHSVWLPEGHFRHDALPSPLVVLAACAARTRRLRLGTTSLLLPLHDPLRVAAEAATLDALSGGRLLLGLGRGFRAPVFHGFGVTPGSKRDRFDEALDAILSAWAGEEVDLAGTHFASPARGTARLALRPLQRPHPPLLVAAFGPKGLDQAARRGLPYLASPLETLGALERNHARWRAQLRPGAEIGTPRVPVMRSVHVAADAAEAAAVLEALRREAALLARGAPEILARAAAEPVEERAIVGEAPAVAEQIERYRERLGMDLLIARSDAPGAEPGAGRASLERLVERVLPALSPVPDPARGA